jgi:hypothetical protein
MLLSSREPRVKRIGILSQTNFTDEATESTVVAFLSASLFRLPA